jgi:hypothetical protein
MVGVCDYERRVGASRESVWNTLTNSQKWRNIPMLADWFGHVEWFEGEPWRVGSRILIEHYWPARRDVRLVLVSIKPPEEFAWIGHDRGLTAHQHTYVEKIDERSCTLSSTMSYASNSDILKVPEVDPMAERILHTFLDAIAQHSEKRSPNTRKVGSLGV